MRRNEIIEAVQTRPFQPFRIHLSDGASFEIRHPEMVMVTRTSALVGVPEDGSPPPAIQRYMLSICCTSLALSSSIFLRPLSAVYALILARSASEGAPPENVASLD
jgi:hypothetical protein